MPAITDLRSVPSHTCTTDTIDNMQFLRRLFTSVLNLIAFDGALKTFSNWRCLLKRAVQISFPQAATLDTQGGKRPFSNRNRKKAFEYTYVSCVADLMHIGHARLFEKCRAFGNEVIAGVHSDAVATSYKRKPVINEKHRYYLVGSNMHIDHVLEDAPLKQTKEFLDANGIDIVVRATDGGAEIIDQFHEVPFREGMIRFVPRTEGLSTSDIISKVARDYADELVNPIVQGNKVVDVTSGGSSNN
eukprot:gene4708-13506_t